MRERTMKRGRAAAAWTRRLGQEAGQGTVEYVALVLLVAAVFGAVVIASTNKSGGETIANKVTSSIKSAVDSVGSKSPGK